MRTWWKALPVAVPLVLLALFAGSIWSASGQLLFPAWKGATRDLSVCPPALAAAWGPACGNLRLTHDLRFREVQVPSLNGYDLPGWLIGAEDNGAGAAEGAILLVHGGGSDRREETRHARYFLGRHLDVLTLDLGCSGEAPCPVPGLSYGERESRDVLSAYLFLRARYPRVLAMGSSVGAASLLDALPAMPDLVAAVAENPPASYDSLIREAPEAAKAPAWALRLLLDLASLRGRFDGLQTPAAALRLVKRTPVFFIHARNDGLIPWQRTAALADLYQGPKRVWFPEAGTHSAIRDADPKVYERRLTDFLDGLEPPGRAR